MANDIEQGMYSVNKHILNNYSETVVHYQDVPHFDNEKNDEWIEPVMLGPVGVIARSSQSHNRWILSVNVFSKIDADTAGNRRNIYRAAEIADVVITLFSKKDIHYLSLADAYLSTLRFAEATVTDLGVEEDLKGLNVSIDCWVIRAV